MSIQNSFQKSLKENSEVGNPFGVICLANFSIGLVENALITDCFERASSVVSAPQN